MGPVAALRRAARRAGVEIAVTEKAHGHIHVRGKILVNWYPYSKRKSAYVAGTSRGEANADAAAVVRMASSAPVLFKTRGKRKRKNYVAWKRRRFKRDSLCHWCHDKMILESGKPYSATVEHVIPLARGGLDNDNNRVLACHKCNHERGHDMPELELT